ncbi:hypothetical protein KPH14_005862, partial [Odynerus spinipes]
MKIVTLLTIPLFWGIVSASPPFREVDGKVSDLNNLHNQESQNKNIPDLETIDFDKDESDDVSRVKLWKRSIFPLFQKDSNPILNKENNEDKKDLGFVLNGFNIGKKIVDHALQVLSKLVQNSKGGNSLLKSEELDKLTNIQADSKPHEVKKRENVQLLNVGGKNAAKTKETDKTKLNKSLKKTADLENQKKTEAKKEEIFNLIPTITVHKEQKHVKPNNNKNDNSSPVNKQKTSNAEALVNVQRNKRGTSMSLWNTSDEDSEETNDVVTHSHVSAVLKNRYATAAEAINSGLAIQKILQQAKANAAEAQRDVGDDYELVHFDNELSKWLDESLEFNFDDGKPIDHYLPPHTPIAKKQDVFIHPKSAYRPNAKWNANARAPPFRHNIPAIRAHRYQNSDVRWRHNKNPGYGNKNHGNTQWMGHNHNSEEDNNDHDEHLYEHLTSHILQGKEHGTKQDIYNIHGKDNKKIKHKKHNMLGQKNRSKYRDYGWNTIASSSAETIHEKTYTPSTWIVQDKIGNIHDDGTPVVRAKALKRKNKSSRKGVGNRGYWNAADSAAGAKASASIVHDIQKNAHDYEKLLPSEWLIDDKIDSSEHYVVPHTVSVSAHQSHIDNSIAIDSEYSEIISTENDVINKKKQKLPQWSAGQQQTGSNIDGNTSDDESTVTSTTSTASDEDHKSSPLAETTATNKNKQTLQSATNRKKFTLPDVRAHAESTATATHEISKEKKKKIAQNKIDNYYSEIDIDNHQTHIPSEWLAKKIKQKIYNVNLHSDDEDVIESNIHDSGINHMALLDKIAQESVESSNEVNQSMLNSDDKILGDNESDTSSVDASTQVIAKGQAETSTRGKSRKKTKYDDITALVNDEDTETGAAPSDTSAGAAEDEKPQNGASGHASLEESDSAAAASTEASGSTDSEVGSSTSDADKPLAWTEGGKKSEHDDSAAAVAEANAEAVAAASATTEGVDESEKPKKGAGGHASLDESDSAAAALATASASGHASLEESDSAAAASTEASASTDSEVGSSTSDADKPLAWTEGGKKSEHDDSAAAVAEANAEAVAEANAEAVTAASGTSEGVDESEKPKKGAGGHASLDESDSAAAALAAAAASAESEAGIRDSDADKPLAWTE